VRRTLLMILLGATGLSAGAAADPVPLYDGRLSPKPASASAAETALLTRELLPAARQAFPGACDGKEGKIAVVDVASGAFTRAGARQKAFLYRYCDKGHNFADNGIAVLEDGRVVAHVVYSAGWDNAIGVLPDVNGNGFSEILIANGMTNQGQTVAGIDLLELTARDVHPLGRVGTYSDDCSGAQGKKASASELYAEKGSKPAFYLQGFTSTDCGKTWKKEGALKPVALERSEVAYRRLK
jgi:hypothetical protein